MSFEVFQKGLTMVDRQGGAAVPTEDGAAQTDAPGGSCDTQNWQWGNPQAMQADLEVVCVPTTVSPRAQPLDLPQDT